MMLQSKRNYSQGMTRILATALMIITTSLSVTTSAKANPELVADVGQGTNGWAKDVGVGFNMVDAGPVIDGLQYFLKESHTDQLWVSDGVSLILLAESDFGTQYGFRELTVFNGELYFVRHEYASWELWKTDGTVAGTQGTGVTGYDQLSYKLVELNGSLFIIAPKRVYKTDGTPTGTSILLNFQSTSSFADVKVAVLNDQVIFSIEAYGPLFEFWKIDSASNVTKITELDAYEDTDFSSDFHSYTDIAVFNNEIYFVTDGQNGRGLRLWKINTVTSETSLVKQINGSGMSMFRRFIEADNYLYFITRNVSSDNLHELWKTDGTETGTIRINNRIRLLSKPQRFTKTIGVANKPIGDELFFLGDHLDDDRNGIYQLWKTNGTKKGTTLVKEIWPYLTLETMEIRGGYDSYLDDISSVVVLGDKIYFSANDGIFGDELWVSDGTESGTKMVSDLIPGFGGSLPDIITATEDTLYYLANDHIVGNELWKYTPDIPTPPLQPSGILGDYIWKDSNGDGVQDANETGLANITVDLLTCDGSFLQSTTSDQDGNYAFTQLAEGHYQMRLDTPAGYSISPEKADGDYLRDSNVDQSTGLTLCYPMAKGQKRTAIDAGMAPNDNGVTDLVSIVSAIYFAADQRLWIRAESDAQPDGAATLTATMIVNGVETVLGTVGWKTDKRFYQQAFRNVTETPDSVILTSDHGGVVVESVQGR